MYGCHLIHRSFIRIPRRIFFTRVDFYNIYIYILFNHHLYYFSYTAHTRIYNTSTKYDYMINSSSTNMIRVCMIIVFLKNNKMYSPRVFYHRHISVRTNTPSFFLFSLFSLSLSFYFCYLTICHADSWHNIHCLQFLKQ